MMLCNHLILDGHAAVFRKQHGGADLVYQLLTHLVKLVGMTELGPPFVTAYATYNQPKKMWGDTGTVAIVPCAESHISIHTFWETGAFNFDLFSCNAFDAESVEAWLVAEYEIVVTGRWAITRNIGG